MNSIQDFRTVIMDTIGHAPAHITPDGSIHRFETSDKARDQAGYCALFDHGNGFLAGYFGCFRSGHYHTWHNKNGGELTQADRQRIDQAQAQAKAERKRVHVETAEKAKAIMCGSAPAPGNHPYLIRKQIKPHGAREDEHGNLVVPVQDMRRILHSLQFIKAEGQKKFLSGGKVAGGYFPLKGNEPKGPVYIAEGFATAASIHEAIEGKHSVLAAFHSGNLQAVAKAVRERDPSRQIIIAADNDHHTEGNPGITAGKEAAAAVGGKVIWPDFSKDESRTDFNDVAQAQGLGAVRSRLEQAFVVETIDPWPDPQPLPDGLPPVPEFEPLLLPESFRNWLTDAAERYQCPLDYLAVGAMVALSGLVGTKFSIRPKRKDDWPVTPNLWGAVVGPPGVMKTPALTEAIRPLKRLEVQAQERFKEESDQYEQDKQIFQALKAERDKEIKKAHREGKNPAEILARYQPPGEPLHRRYLVNDTTVEALAEILQSNPEGTCAYRDELMGLLKMLDKEGQEHSRAFYLEAWHGNDTYSSDRIGRGHVHIPQCCLSLLGGIQPGRLQSYVMEAVKGGAGDDGLIQRFQLLVWPDISKDWKDVDRWPDTEAKNQAFVGFDSLDLRPPENFPFRFDEEAQDLFIEWRTKLELKIRASEDHPAIEAHLAKYRSLVPSLALLIALADNPHLKEKVSLRAMEQAAAWAEYLEAHARRVYSAVTRSDTLAAEALAKKISEGAVEDGITLRGLRRKEWARLNDYDLLKDAIGLLEDLNWLRPEKEQSAGRPKTVIRINPTLLKKN